MIELMARKGFAADGSRLPGWVKSDAPAPPPAAEAGVSAGVAGKLLGLFDKKKAEAASPAEEEEKARPGRSTLARAALGVGCVSFPYHNTFAILLSFILSNSLVCTPVVVSCDRVIFLCASARVMFLCACAIATFLCVCLYALSPD